MEITDYRKTVGWSLIILFTVILLNQIVAILPVAPDNILYKIRDWWFILSQIIQGAAVIFATFNRRFQTSVVSKTGAVIYAAMMLVFISNRIYFHIAGESLIYFEGISEYLNSILLSLGLMLFVWGLRELWLPIKIVATVSAAVSITTDMLFARLVWMYRNMTDLTFGPTDRLQNIINIFLSLYAIIVLALIVLAIVWVYIRKDTSSVQKQYIDQL